MVLIQLAVNALLTQAIGEIADSGHVLG